MDDRQKPGPSWSGTGNNGRGGRLPSFKAPRDLTLASGSATGRLPVPPRVKKNYVPNIPPKRDRGLPSSNLVEPLSSKSKLRATGTSTTANSGNRQSNQKDKKKVELVQSASIFGEGVGNPVLNPKRYSAPSARGRGGVSGSAARFKSEGGRENTRTKTAFGVRHKGDDNEDDDPIGGFDNFIADLDEGEVPGNLIPISLPLSAYNEDLWLSEPVPQIKRKVHVKSEIRNLSDQKVKLANGSFGELVKKPTQDLKGTLAFFQFPDQIPVYNSTESDTQLVKQGKLSNDIGTLPEGYIGKIQILASGRSRFVLGENYFDLEQGKLVGFRQELAAIDEVNKKMTMLGPVRHKFICIPDINSLFKNIL